MTDLKHGKLRNNIWETRLTNRLLQPVPAHQDALAVGVDHVHEGGVGRVKPDEAGHPLEERLGRVEAGDPPQAGQPLPCVARYVSPKAETNSTLLNLIFLI